MNFEYGFDSKGVDNLLEEIKGKVLRDAAGHAVNNLNIITKACDANWQGQSKTDFIAHLKKDADQFAASLKTLYDAFEREISNANYEFDKFDKNLLDKF